MDRCPNYCGRRRAGGRDEAIGDAVEHSSRVLFVDQQYGYPLMYHGQVSGDAWPTSDDLTAEQLGNLPALDARARYIRDFATFAATHFIMTDLGSLDAQPDLQQLSVEISTLLKETPTPSRVSTGSLRISPG